MLQGVTRIQELVIELTDWCPLRCRHCSSDSGPFCKNSLSQEVVTRLVAEAVQLEASQVSFGGGEPTGSPLLLSTIRHLAAVGIPSEVFTCGVILRDGSVAPFASELVRGLVAVRDHVSLIFSMHGASPDVHDLITQSPGSHQALVASVTSCLEAGIRCAANFVPLQPNVHDFEAVVDMVGRLGLDKLSVLRFVPQGRGADGRSDLELNRQEENELVDRVLALREQSGVEIRTGSPFNGIIPNNNVLCRAGISKLVIQADGNVLPCEVFKHRKRRQWQASIYDMGLAEILSSERFRQLQQVLDRVGCRDCPVHSHLRGTYDMAKTGEIHGFSKTTIHS